MRLHQIRAPLRYAPPADHLIHKLKYEGHFGLAEPLAQLMTTGWPRWSHSFDLLAPIPLHAERRRSRGYNQSALLAEHLGQARGLRTDKTLLRRVRNTIPQVGLNLDERRQNVRAAFQAEPSRAARKHILLIDDVYTTGATMSAAAEALLAAGASGVSGYCLARAV